MARQAFARSYVEVTQNLRKELHDPQLWFVSLSELLQTIQSLTHNPVRLKIAQASAVHAKQTTMLPLCKAM